MSQFDGGDEEEERTCTWQVTDKVTGGTHEEEAAGHYFLEVLKKKVDRHLRTFSNCGLDLMQQSLGSSLAPNSLLRPPLLWLPPPS